MTKFNYQPGTMLIRTRALGLKDLTYARLLKPYEDGGHVYDLPRNKGIELSLVNDIVSSHVFNTVGFSNVLADSSKRVIPSQLYQHLHQRDNWIPTLLVANYHPNGHFTRVESITDYHQLQSLLGTLHSRGVIADTRNLL